MRIGFDSTPLFGQRAGVGNYTGNLLAGLVQTQPDWDYLLYSNKPLPALEENLRGTTAVSGYLPRSRWLWMQFMLPRVIRQSKPDICHFPNNSAPLWVNVPYIVTIHDVMAAKDGNKEQIVYETADLWFHTLVMLAQQDLGPDEVLDELGRRFGLSGLEEKANRTNK